jgi:N,N-dimethylformamidase beta subunit-like, C-terminal
MSRDAIAAENQRQGTTDWLLTHAQIDPATKYRCPWIEGYCSHTSARAGDSISFYVSANPASPFTLDIYRMGYYGGAGGRHMLTLGPFEGAPQPDPPIGPRRVRDCDWAPCATLAVPKDWLSGVYLGKLTELRGGWQSYIIFIVRDDRVADLIFQCSDLTWQAYNRWPSQFSLYDDGENVWHCGLDSSVSFNRPYGKYCQLLDAPLSLGSGEWFLWEFPLAYWLESHGYDVTYISNLDMHADPANLRRAQGLLSVGHDEYYSIEMYDTLKNAIADGLSVAFLCGDSISGRIALEPNGAGRPDRIYRRTDCFGPPEEGDLRQFPEKVRFPFTSPDASAIMGVRSTWPFVGGADWTCRKPDHWLFAGTGMQEGDGIPGLVGWEVHTTPAAIPGLEIVAGGPTSSDTGPGTYTATVYYGPKGNVVFNAATCWWTDGLAAPPGYVRSAGYVARRGPDQRVQRITTNVLERIRRTPQ